MGKFAVRPIELAILDNDTAERSAVPADGLGSRIDNNIRSVGKGIEQVRCTEGVINNERDAMRMGNCGNRFDIEDGRIGVADALNQDGLGIWRHCIVERSRVIRICHKIHMDPEPRIQ
ncbi:hypothetical protein D3C73_1157830 [compost metagenome]